MPICLCSAADLIAVTGGDPFVRSQLRHRLGRAWNLEGAVAFVRLDAENKPRGLAALGEPLRVAGLVAAAVREVPEVSRLSVPRGTLPLLPAWLHIEGATDWDFRSTAAPPPEQPGEDSVGWLDDAAGADVKELLTVANPETSVWPGDAKVRRWAGIRGASDRLDACLADTSGANGVGHVSAISTRPQARGQGLGAAITAWATRRLFEEGCDTVSDAREPTARSGHTEDPASERRSEPANIVTLGMYAGNDVARRIYDRLGFSDDHHFTSGVIDPSTAAMLARHGGH